MPELEGVIIPFILLIVLLVLFIVANFFTRKELPFKQAKIRIISIAISFSKIDGKCILGKVEEEFAAFMDKYGDEFLRLLKSKNLVSLRENINVDDLCKIGRLFADFKIKIENKMAAI